MSDVIDLDGPFIDPIAMEDDPDELYPGDRGVLDPEVRHVLVRLLQRRFLLAERNPAQWKALLDNQQIVESRLGDLYVRLVVDHDRGVAYKQQVRSDELEVPILLKDEAYTRVETLVLIHLRTVFQRERTAGESSARVDLEEIEQTVLTYFTDADGDLARKQRAIRNAIARLRSEGVVDEESESRYRISPLVEIVLNLDRLLELKAWLREQNSRGDEPQPDPEPGSDDDLDDGQEPGADAALEGDLS